MTKLEAYLTYDGAVPRNRDGTIKDGRLSVIKIAGNGTKMTVEPVKKK